MAAATDACTSGRETPPQRHEADEHRRTAQRQKQPDGGDEEVSHEAVDEDVRLLAPLEHDHPSAVGRQGKPDHAMAMTGNERYPEETRLKGARQERRCLGGFAGVGGRQQLAVRAEHQEQVVAVRRPEGRRHGLRHGDPRRRSQGGLEAPRHQPDLLLQGHVVQVMQGQDRPEGNCTGRQ